ncbi:unnamed protein product [Blepharisma stoltei]|uniref:Saposin B-type domain-containing protein n=1 Tax=Blepharisma stoltei TaxID=1481888 RepID=A0AAU9JXU3_9CILI|nr:unnamed protein product [Blepharisma stoltei]
MSGCKLFLILSIIACLSQAKVTVTSIETLDFVEADGESNDLCAACFQFAGADINVLLNYVLDHYIIGSCEELCGILHTELEKVFCNVLCDYVGIRAFIEALVSADLDPIYYCQLLGQCPAVAGGAGNITSISILPTNGPVGTTFTVTMNFNITQRTGTGQIGMNITAPGDYGQNWNDFLNEGFMPGPYSVQISIDTRGDFGESNYWPTGNYLVQLYLCSGMCGSNHPRAFLIDSGNSTLTLTSN